jgi:hypothetical protein
MDRAPGDYETDVGIRLHRPEGFANVAKFYGWLHSGPFSVDRLKECIRLKTRRAGMETGAARFKGKTVRYAYCGHALAAR